MLILHNVPNRDGRTLEFESGQLGALDAFLMPGGAGRWTLVGFLDAVVPEIHRS
jgi:hypothetical protein